MISGCIAKTIEYKLVWLTAAQGRPPHAEPKLAWQERPRDAVKGRCLSVLIFWVIVIWGCLHVLARLRARSNHKLLSVPLHLANVEEIGSAPPAANSFDVLRRDALAEEGGCSSDPNLHDTTITPSHSRWDDSVDMVWEMGDCLGR